MTYSQRCSMHSRMCFVDRPVHIEKGYGYVHTQTRHASWLFFPSWSKHIQNESLPYGAGNTLKLLNQVIHFGFSGAFYVGNGEMIQSMTMKKIIPATPIPYFKHQYRKFWDLNPPLDLLPPMRLTASYGSTPWGFWTCCWWSRPWCSIASFSKQVRGMA